MCFPVLCCVVNPICLLKPMKNISSSRAASSHNHSQVLAVLPKGRDTWEVYVNQEDIRDYFEVEGLTIREGTVTFIGGNQGAHGSVLGGIPVNLPNEFVNMTMNKYGDVVVEATHCT